MADFNGFHVTYWYNGNIETEANYLNGLLHGDYKSYRVGGEILFTTTFVNGQEHGILTKFYHDGTIEYKVEYREGQFVKSLAFNKRQKYEYNK